jgi:voltage-gated potassium channel
MPEAKALESEGEQIRVTDLFLMLLSILSLVAILVLTFMDLDPEMREILIWLDTAICLFFLSVWFYRLLHAPDRKQYVRLYWMDFLASIPMVEPLRAARIFQVLRVIRVIRVSQVLLRHMFHPRELTMMTLGFTILFMMAFSSIMILLFEDHAPNANIHSAEEALWWSLVTISTVGYGDHYPVTMMGKIFAGVLILCGVSFFGVLSGYMASLFTQKRDKVEENQDMLRVLQAQQLELLQELQTLKQDLNQRQDGA